MKKKIIKIIIIMILFIVGIILTYFVTKKVYTKPIIKEIRIFGETIKINSNKRVYRFYMDSAKIKYTGDGCTPEPIEIIFKDGYEEYEGFSYIENGVDHVYVAVTAKKKNAKGTNKVETKSDKIDLAFSYDAYVEVILDKPLEIDEKCDTNIEE